MLYNNLTNATNTMIIWQTYYNADMTEGRGPMIPSYAFLHREHAAAYIDAQEGVMGCRAKWSEQEYGDWRMKKIEVLEHDYMESEQRKEKVKRQALNKLTQEEKEILGLL
jgi:hypothetical protein